MREFKFRAWDKESRRIFDIARFDFADYTVYSHIFACEGYLAENLKIMQYTGLKDKNGKEIYEGDIVIVGQKETPAEVIFENGCFYTPVGISRYRLGGWNKESLEVIGNIFENPELLGGIK